jgi:hypothetical protein
MDMTFLRQRAAAWFVFLACARGIEDSGRARMSADLAELLFSALTATGANHTQEPTKFFLSKSGYHERNF